MKIDFIKEYNSDYPQDSIVRLYEFNSNEVIILKDIFHELSKGIKKEFELTKLQFIYSKDGITLNLKTSLRDEGISKVSEKKFICKLSKEGWEKARDLTQPFCESDINGYQWLFDLDTDIDLLLSKNGSW